jgi:hypothetical protein
MKWEGDKKERFTVASGEKGPTIYRADADGTLTIIGADWKECLRERCRRVPAGSWGIDKKCLCCSRSGSVQLNSQHQAIAIAEQIEGKKIKGVLA